MITTHSGDQMEETTIKSLDKYISVVSKYMEKYKNDNKIVVFRGEANDYGESACVPNIFRKNILTYNPKFEKNLFDEMTANDLTIGNNYLEKAISAQHDGFPSRLLDVTYNCLVALYFACTPHYNKPEDSLDNEDGRVFLFVIEKMFCPTGENIVDNYNEIVKRSEDSFIKNQIFGKNHKLIDHIKTNKRIIAQQGAFILFQGDEYEPIPKRLCKTIIIDRKAKRDLRTQLSSLFGIDTGSIYPQAENFVSKMIHRSSYVDNSEFSFENELKMIIHNIDQDFNFYINELFKSNNKTSKYEIVCDLENNLKDYKIGLENLRDSILKNKDCKIGPENLCESILNSKNCNQKKIIQFYISKYNKTIESEITYINKILINTNITIETSDFEVMYK